MDRSITQRKVVSKSFLMIILQIIFITSTVFAEANKNTDESLRGFSTLTFGNIFFLDKDFRYLQIYPLRGDKQIKTFYLDKSTLVVRKKNRVKRKTLTAGTDIAIRAIEYNNTSVAEAIFIIDQENIDASEFNIELRKYR